MLDLRRMLPLVPALLRAVSNYWSFEPEKLGQELLVNHGSLNHLILIWECQFSLFPDVAKSQIPLGHLLPQLPTEWSIRIDFNPLSPGFWTILTWKKHRVVCTTQWHHGDAEDSNEPAFQNMWSIHVNGEHHLNKEFTISIKCIQDSIYIYYIVSRPIRNNK